MRTKRRAHGWLAAELANPNGPTFDAPPPTPVALDSERAHTACQQGRAALETGRYADAWNHFCVALGFASGDELLLAEALAGQGQARLGQWQQDAARELFRQALQHNPAHVGAHLGLADLASQGRQGAEAIELLYEVLPVLTDPAARANIHLRLAATYLRLGTPRLAWPHLRAAWALDERPAQRQHALGLAALSLTRSQWALLGLSALGLLLAVLASGGGLPWWVGFVILIGEFGLLSYRNWNQAAGERDGK
jgi:tetratricopeptide (TPR) repeat protein